MNASKLGDEERFLWRKGQLGVVKDRRPPDGEEPKPKKLVSDKSKKRGRKKR
jgi:hypothetical protein